MAFSCEILFEVHSVNQLLNIVCLWCRGQEARIGHLSVQFSTLHIIQKIRDIKMEEIMEKIREASEEQEKVTELNLSGIKITKFTKEMTEALEQCKDLELLILSKCELESLEGLPKLNLEGIDVSCNRIKDNDLQYLKQYARLWQLLLSSNQIENIESLKALADCKELSDLDASENPMASDPNYHKFCFETLLKLNSLDNKDVDGNDIPEEDEFDDDEQEDGDEEGEEFEGEDDEDECDQDEEDSDSPKNKKKGKK